MLPLSGFILGLSLRECKVLRVLVEIVISILKSYFSGSLHYWHFIFVLLMLLFLYLDLV